MAGSTETSTWTLALRDETSAPARNAAQALADLRAKIDEDTKALRSMQQAWDRLNAAQQVDVKLARDLQSRMTALRNAIASNQAQVLQLGGGLDGVQSGAKRASGGLSGLLGAARGMPGPIGAVAGRLGSLESVLGSGVAVAGALGLAAAFLAVVAASAALVTGIAAATAQLLRYGIAQSDARRSELLHLEGLTRLRSMYGLAAGSATELQGAIDRVSASSALGRSAIAGHAEQLYRMGLRGESLEQALDAVSIAGAAGGEGLARRFAGMAAAAARTGGSVRALAETVRARFGGIAERQAISLGRQMERLQENVAAIFGTLKIEGFLRALRSVASLFEQSTASGRALRGIVEVLFQPMIDGIARSGPLVRRFFQGVLIGGLRLGIVFMRLRNFVLRAFGGSDVLGAIDAQTAALYVGLAAVGALAVAVIAATAVMAAFVAPLVLAYVAFRKLQEAWAAGVRLFDSLADAGRRAGTSLIDGFVGAIVRGRDLVRETVGGLAGAATMALRDALQIRSPSRVFAELGAQIPRGLAVGIDDGAGATQGAVEQLVDAPEGAGVGGAGRAPISIGDVHIHMAPGSDEASGRDIARTIVDELVRQLQGAGIELGAAT